MSKVEMLRAQVNQRLTAAVDEILGLFDRTIVEYEEEFFRSQNENLQLRKQLRAVFSPEVRLHRAVFPADIQQLLVQKEWSPCLNQKEPEPPHIKEEREELWVSQEVEQLHGLEEADSTKFTFTLVPVKNENDEGKVQSSQLHQSQTKENTEAQLLSNSPTEQIKTEADEEDGGGPENTRNLDPDLWTNQEGEQLHGLEEADGTMVTFTLIPVKSEDDEAIVQHSQPHQSQTEEKTKAELLFSCFIKQTETEVDREDCGAPEPTRNLDPKSLPPPVSVSDSCEPKIEYGEDYSKDTREPQSGLNTLKTQSNEEPVSEMGCNPGKKSFNCSVCGATFKYNKTQKVHMRIHTGEKPFSCSVCSKTFTQSGHLKRHMRIHTGEKPFSCSFCGKNFSANGDLKKHTRVHTGEKPFCCSLCGKHFTISGNLKHHLRSHTGEKPYGCSDRGKKYRQSENLRKHVDPLQGEKTQLQCLRANI